MDEFRFDLGKVDRAYRGLVFQGENGPEPGSLLEAAIIAEASKTTLLTRSFSTTVSDQLGREADSFGNMLPHESLGTLDALGCGRQPQLAIVDDQNNLIARVKT